jgi:3-deoxy-manno-octulosonate cytidylyltransferase (CMP-KDO synthetase)
MNFKIVIPARFASTRFPGKPLELINGQPMIVRVVERALATQAASVTVATDDERIARALVQLPIEVMLTDPNHPSGTDRLAEVAIKKQWSDTDIIVNVQGDEPMMVPGNVQQVAECLHRHSDAAIATLCTPIQSEQELLDPNVVKVVCTHQEQALYFSRAPIPWPRDAMRHHLKDQRLYSQAQRHIGLYAYRVASLIQLSQLAPTPLEMTEQLEQLRAMEHGLKVVITPAREVPGPGVDTPEDLARINLLLSPLP